MKTCSCLEQIKAKLMRTYSGLGPFTPGGCEGGAETTGGGE